MIIIKTNGKELNVGTVVRRHQTNGRVPTIALDMKISDGDWGCMDVPIAELVKALDAIEGVTARYEEPVEVPRRIGSTVTGEGYEIYTRYKVSRPDNMPWISSLSGHVQSDTFVADLIRKGAQVTR